MITLCCTQYCAVLYFAGLSSISAELFFSSPYNLMSVSVLQLLITAQLLEVKQVWGILTLMHCKRLHFFALFFFFSALRLYLSIYFSKYSFIIMPQSNCKPLTAAAVFRPCSEMEDESDWLRAKRYCQCNTTSVIPPVRKAMSVKRRCL